MPLSSLLLPSQDLPKQLFDELGASVRGQVYLRGNVDFVEYSSIFNGNVKTAAKAVVCPFDAEDVSKIILFCTKHSLSPSIKAGGYGTAGWAIGGDIIIDLSKLTDIDIETPQSDGSFVSLRDMPSIQSKGKNKASSISTDFSSNSGKRRREDDAGLRIYDSASRAVASFLRGPPLPHESSDFPPSSIRRRFGSDPEHLASQLFQGSENNALSLDSNITSEAASTVVTSAPPPRANIASPDDIYVNTDKITSSSLHGGDPFGYLNSTSNFPPAPPPHAVQTAYNPRAMFNSWAVAASGSSTPFPAPEFSPASLNILAPAHPIHPLAYVTFGAGMRQKEIDIYTADHPLEATSIGGNNSSIPYHVPFAAHPVGSSIMILGGFGFLSRLHGLSIDNLVEVEMVLADGRIVIVNENEYPDLWWALRGAGPVLGVATRYKAKAYPVPVVYAGNLIYRFHSATAPSLIKHFRDCVKGAPRELYANVLLTAGPAGKDSLVVIQICYIGPKERGQEYLAAISSWDGEKCLLNEVDEKSFLHQQDSVAQVLRGKAGRQWFIRSALITSLPDDVVNRTVIEFAGAPVGCTWLFELAGGAISDFEDTCLPKSQREASFTIAALHQWEMGVDDPRCISSAEDWISGTLGPVQTGGPFPSFLGRHEPASRTISCFGDNWKRLCEIKQQYDPKGLFRNTFWPLDAQGEPVEPHTHEPATP